VQEFAGKSAMGGSARVLWASGIRPGGLFGCIALVVRDIASK